MAVTSVAAGRSLVPGAAMPTSSASATSSGGCYEHGGGGGGSGRGLRAGVQAASHPGSGAPAGGSGRSPQFLAILHLMRKMRRHLLERGASAPGPPPWEAVCAAPAAVAGGASPAGPPPWEAVFGAPAAPAGGVGGGEGAPLPVFMRLFLGLSLEENYTLLTTNLVSLRWLGQTRPAVCRTNPAGCRASPCCRRSRAATRDARLAPGCVVHHPPPPPPPDPPPTHTLYPPTQPTNQPTAGDRGGCARAARGPVGARRQRPHAER
jgi:hypothetical protein